MVAFCGMNPNCPITVYVGFANPGGYYRGENSEVGQWPGTPFVKEDAAKGGDQHR